MSDGYIYVGDLSDKHQKALRIFVDKYRKGAAEHGDLASNKLWTRDMLSETIDLAFYMSFQIMEHLDGDVG